MSESFDPVLFEILRHRLWAINDEAATTIARISGSPVANEAYDFNAALMTRDGEVIMIGAYVMAHAAALGCIVDYVQEEYADNPGIGPGDMFMTNDPYVGAMHQPDVAVVAPIFREGELIMWCGSVVHQTDVGGPLAGSVTTGATSIYEEAIPLAPIRMVESGRIRKDLEREYLIRSRMPGLNALDMRGQIAANRVQTTRILELCDRYGTETVLGAADNLLSSTERQFRDRLATMPDGRWTAVSFVEHDGVSDAVYPVELAMTKHGDSLVLDFTGSADQAPSLINCSAGTLRGYIVATLLTLLAYDLPWVPAALWRAVEVRTRAGSVVDATWPAGVSMGNTSVGHAVRTVANVCIATMLDGSDAYADKVMASCMGSVAGQNISGFREDGARFGTMLLDFLAGGGGARAFADGVDTSGVLNAPASAIGNVETNELNYPLLYLWRRQTADSGGPGRFRGGVGGDHAYITHHAQGPFGSTLFAHGVEQPTSTGLVGGEPSSPHGFLLAEGARESAPRRVEDVREHARTLPPKGTLQFGTEDVFVHLYSGGGGLGDPLDREVAAVVADVEELRVSPDGARAHYGVVVQPLERGRWTADEDATAELRRGARRERIGHEPLERGATATGRRMTSTLNITDGADGRWVCRACAATLGPVAENVKAHLVREDVAVTRQWPETAQLEGSTRFELRRFHCPGCATQLEAEINLVGREPIATIEVVP